ncbi:MAG: type II toxin-antitoxin system RelE/ParE family toxin [Gammaproteobacteria bacterium]|nr:type II toxin-antitoxin system RelE/ParE family toxin [Gammaproteobacteria bacterium]
MESAQRPLIASFADMRTEDFYNGRRVAAFSGFARTASRKLDQLDAATALGDLTRPGNRLEKLKGDREGQWSVRINDQWRICFLWPDASAGPTKVQIVDYH